MLDREPTKEERKTHKNIATMTSEISYQSFRTDLNGPTGKWLQSALIRGFEEKPILQRMSGGSIPIAPFVNALDVPAVTVPTVNRDNNQHSPNENIRLGNYVEGIKTILAILTEPFNLKTEKMNRALLLTRVVFGFLIVYLHGIPKLMGGPERWQRLGSSLSGSLGIDGVNVFFGFMAMMAEILGGIFDFGGLVHQD